MLSQVASTRNGAVSGPEVSFESARGRILSAEARLLALIIQTQVSQRDAAETSVNLSFDEIQKLRAEVKRAIEEAREAKQDAGFWSELAEVLGGDVATIATAIAAAAAVVASGGAAAAVLAVVASAASFAAKHAEELGIPPEVAIGIAVAASVAGLCCGNGKGLFDLGEKAVAVSKDVKACASVVAAGATGAGAASGAVAGQYEGAARDHQADARRAEGQQDVISVDIDRALDLLASSLDRQLRAASVSSDIQQNSLASRAVILNNFAGAA
jgi:hypothetical protein